MVGGASPAPLAVVAVEGGEVHLLHRVEDEEGEVVLGEPVGDRRREQVELVALGDEEVVGHDVIVAIGPVQVVDLPRATRAFAGRLRGSCNRLIQIARRIGVNTASRSARAEGGRDFAE